MEPEFEHLLPANWQQLVETWLHEDIPGFDIGGYVVGNKAETALLYGKTDGVLAGRPFFDCVFDVLDCKVEWFFRDGDRIDTSSGDGKVVVAKVTGTCRNILQGERTALNIISRCSGVASATAQAVKEARMRGWNGHVAGTRKTTPGFRLVEKYALIVGGGATHRYDLSQMVMLKDNHIASAEGITNAVMAAKRVAGFSIKIEVEASSYEQAAEAARAGADIVMLDNFEPAELQILSRRLKNEYPHVVLEASGGITSETFHLFLMDSIDVISQGSLTYGYKCLDFSLKVVATETSP